MATDFYERQYQARKLTRRLLALFTLAVIAIVGGAMMVAWVALQGNNSGQSFRAGAGADDLMAMLAAGGGSLALIGGGSLFKIAQLAGGGTTVAERLGGRRVFPDTTDLVERRLLNVVEEMALASGVPVPPVFLLAEEQGVNAFAAGYSPSDAVVAVTRGTAEQLTRDELQGVVAHEFSHILNGDMRLNIRMIGILHGLLLVGLIGRIMIRMAARTRGGRGKNNPAAYLFLVGAALAVLGYLGTLFGGLIKAAVSRQREYLADASGVQFTRNPEGLAGALKRIGSLLVGSRVAAVNAAEANHMFFAAGIWEGFTGLMATHPPLEDRIRRLDPAWDGDYPPAPAVPAARTEIDQQAASFVGAATASELVPLRVVKHAADQVGDPTERHRRYAAALVESLPAFVRESARAPYGARAVLFALLTDRQLAVRERQLARLAELTTPDVLELTLKLLPEIDNLDVRARLPLVDLALPSLRAMSRSQYQDFLKCFQELVRADNRLGLFEWTLHRILLRHLRPQYEKTAPTRPAYYGLQRLGPQCSVLLSTLAHADNRRAEAPAAVARGAEKLPDVSVRLLDASECGLEALSGALDTLAHVADKKRRHLVDACAATICADREVTVAEAELLRGVCDMLDCPMPPLLPGGPATAPDQSNVA
jgi:Zn-dependent protease with chaperone function